VRDVLGRGPSVYGTLLAVHALFGIAGTLAVGHLGVRVAARDLIGWSSLVAGVALTLRFSVPSVPLAYALTPVTGVTSVVAAVGVQTLVQQGVRDEYRGRVFGALGASGALLSLAGAVVGGTAAELVGLVPMLDVAAALVAVSGVVVLRVFRPRAEAAL
jgi:MFS family permease